MKRKFFTTLGILVVLLVSLVGTVAAQSGSGPETTPTVAPTATATAVPTTTTATQTTAGSKFFMHPVVKLLDAYFGEKPEAQTNDVTATASETPDPSVTPTAGETPVGTSLDQSESGLTPTGEQIAAFHEDGMGFGVLVKIYAMVKASEDACKAQTATGTDTTAAAADGATTGDTTTVEACTPLTADELVAEFKGGAGMGTLFKEYGKPALLGVGHVKQAMKDKAKDGDDTELTDDQTTTETDATLTDGNGQGKDKVNHNKIKVKTNKNNGKNKK